MNNYWQDNNAGTPAQNPQPAPQQPPPVPHYPYSQPVNPYRNTGAAPQSNFYGPRGGQAGAPSGGGPKPAKKGNGKLIALFAAISILCSAAGTAVGLSIGRNTTTDLGSTSGPVIQSVDPGEMLADTETSSFSAVVNMTKKSVVEIMTETTQSGTYFGGSIEQGAGSGVIISEDGYILTNNHVITGASIVTVALNDGSDYEATVIGADAKTDIAVIKIEAAGLSPAVLGDSSYLQVGDCVLAIGNPLGSLGGTVTDGIISALDREIVVEGQTMRLLQTSAAVNPGNSGGGLFNMRGELVGIVNAKSTGTDIEGLGFAVPINTVKDIIDDLMEIGYVTGRPALGVKVLEILDSTTAKQYGVTRFGVYIVEVTPGGAAQKAGLMVGDYVVSANGTAIDYSSDLINIISESSVGDTISLQIIRDDKSLTIDVVLADSAQS